MTCPACTGIAWDPCRLGCHDGITFHSANEGIEVLSCVLEDWANGDISEFELRIDPVSGKDGLDEATELAMLLLIEQEARP